MRRHFGRFLILAEDPEDFDMIDISDLLATCCVASLVIFGCRDAYFGSGPAFPVMHLQL